VADTVDEHELVPLRHEAVEPLPVEHAPPQVDVLEVKQQERRHGTNALLSRHGPVGTQVAWQGAEER
jgi:hypothetical protein